MRIVGGKWRGRQIEAPDGRDVTRPTTDRTREQIASMILSAAGLDLSGASVLDAFAGLCERSLPGAPFGVVFLDPPYALDAGEVSRLVGLLASSGQLERGAIVVYERSSKAEGLDCPGLALAKTKTRGITAVDLHVYEEDPK